MNSSKSGEGGACNPAEMENRASKLTSQQTFQDATVLVAAGLAGRGLDILGQLRVLLRSHRVNEVLAEQPIYCNTRPAREHDGVTVSPPARDTPLWRCDINDINDKQPERNVYLGRRMCHGRP